MSGKMLLPSISSIRTEKKRNRSGRISVAMIDAERRSRMTQGPNNGTSEAIRTE
jgi:hypothetical protein